MSPVLFMLHPLKMQFSMFSYKPIHHAFDYNYIQTSSLIQRKRFPLFPGELQFSEEEHHSRTREEMKKSSSAHVRP